MVQHKARGITVLERFQLLAEDNGSTVAVTVYEGKRAQRLYSQRGLDNGKDRRDAAAGGKCQVVFCMGGVEAGEEASRRGQNLQRIAGFQLLVGKGGKQALVYFLNGHA